MLVVLIPSVMVARPRAATDWSMLSVVVGPMNNMDRNDWMPRVLQDNPLMVSITMLIAMTLRGGGGGYGNCKCKGEN